MTYSISKISDKEFWLTIEKGGAMKNITKKLKAKNFNDAKKETQNILAHIKNNM